MKFTVVWRPTAERTLAEIWTNAIDRQDVTNAANTIDALLSTGPLDVGESREGQTRFLAVQPLSVFYDVFEDDQLVAVWSVWRVGHV